jgi:hypothetical protein
MSSSILRYSFAFNVVELNELFSNICRFSLGNVGLGSYDGAKYTLIILIFTKKYKALFTNCSSPIYGPQD